MIIEQALYLCRLFCMAVWDWVTSRLMTQLSRLHIDPSVRTSRCTKWLCLQPAALTTPTDAASVERKHLACPPAEDDVCAKMTSRWRHAVEMVHANDIALTAQRRLPNEPRKLPIRVRHSEGRHFDSREEGAPKRPQNAKVTLNTDPNTNPTLTLHQLYF